MPQEPLAKAYEPKAVESHWYPVWEKAGYFTADPKSPKKPFSIMIPPPNVTGSLHIGHAFTLGLQDVIVRWKRMSGYDVLWLPGLDHAGIATQVVVTRELEKEGKRKEDLGREAFEKRIWEWKQKSGGQILNQLRTMGFSLDWTRERFTLDPMLSRAVREVFVSLWEQKLIYRGEYIINWCPGKCLTALSDLEVESEVTNGKLWHIRYRAADGGPGIVVATTRPETLLGDTAVAVHPDDERYKSLIGTMLTLPVLGREIPVVADSFVEKEFGTGAVKVTPAHDPNDFAAGQRLGLPSINIMDERAVLNENAGPYAGLDRFAAREKLVAQLEAEGLLEKTAPHQVPLGHCQRCHTIVEPRLSMQWYVKIKPLADPAIAAVERGDIKFIPEHWSKTYFEWMRNIRDWCISRQLWWGHRIPAWTCGSCQEIIVSREDPATCPKCQGKDLVQETDVLDTWFSSGLFPFSTLGWPEKTDDVKRYYPNDVMMTGFDIIFFWVARMIMFSIGFMKEPPFQTVFLNGVVRDKHGKKMSKTAGNAVDPLEMVDKYGADALRFTLTALASAGNDPKLDVERLEGYGKFVNKLWNASRFVLMNLEGEIAPGYELKELPLASRWILGRTQAVIAEVETGLSEYRFDHVANTLYHFVWHDFCDWYIELSKSYLNNEKEAPRARRVLLDTLDTILRLLHPVIPFVTEEIWQRLPKPVTAPASIMIAPFPASDETKNDVHAVAEMEKLQALIIEIRTIRATYEVEPRRRIDVTIVAKEASDRAFLARYEGLIRDLARIETLTITGEAMDTPGTIKHPAGAFDLRIPMAGLFDMAAEKTRLSKERLKIDAELEGLQKKLGNPQFVERAKPEVVQQNRDRVVELTATREKIEVTLRELGSGS